MPAAFTLRHPLLLTSLDDFASDVAAKEIILRASGRARVARVARVARAWARSGGPGTRWRGVSGGFREDSIWRVPARTPPPLRENIERCGRERHLTPAWEPRREICCEPSHFLSPFVCRGLIVKTVSFCVCVLNRKKSCLRFLVSNECFVRCCCFFEGFSRAFVVVERRSGQTES